MKASTDSGAIRIKWPRWGIPYTVENGYRKYYVVIVYIIVI